MTQRKYDSTVARIAGNIISGMGEGLLRSDEYRRELVELAVETARWIVAETIRTEPAPPESQ